MPGSQCTLRGTAPHLVKIELRRHCLQLRKRIGSLVCPDVQAEKAHSPDFIFKDVKGQNCSGERNNPTYLPFSSISVKV